MNRLIQQLARNYHLTFRKKWRDLVFQTFGHEAPIPQADLADVSHCMIFNEDFYRLGTIDFQKHLARRKWLNPFKWAEFLLVMPPELAAWAWRRGMVFLWDACWTLEDKAIRVSAPWKKTGLELARHLLLGLLFPLEIGGILFDIATNVATGMVRRILAPARYIIRPSLDMLKSRPLIFAGLVAATLALTAAAAVTLLTGGIALPVFLAPLALTVAGKVSLIALTAGTLWASLVKCSDTVIDAVHAIQSMRAAPSHASQARAVKNLNKKLKQEARDNPSCTTARITSSLHALSPDLTHIRPLEQQDLVYDLVSFTGTNVLAWPNDGAAIKAAPEDRAAAVEGENLPRPARCCTRR